MKKSVFIISLIAMVVSLTSCQKNLQDRLLDRAKHRIEAISNAEADSFCYIYSGVSSGKVYIDTLGIFSKDWLIEFEKSRENDARACFNGRDLEGKWHSFEWKSLDADAFSILRDTIHYNSNGKDLTICDMVVPMSGQGYRIKNVTYEEACDGLSSSLLFEVENVMSGIVVRTSFWRLMPGATELVTAEGWTNLRHTKDGDSIHHEVDWFENGKCVKTYTFTTKHVDWYTENGWSNPTFNVYGGVIEYQINWYKNGEIVKRFAEKIADKKLPISEWEKLS